MTSSRNTGKRRSVRRIGIVLAAAVTGGLAAGGVQAQVLVHDPGVVVSNEHGFASQLAQTVEQYAKQVQQYVLQLQQYQQMLVNLQNLPNLIPSFNNNFPQLDATRVVEMQCSGSTGSIVSDIMQALTSSFGSPYMQAQQRICEQLVRIQVEKYNITAEMLNRMNGYSSLARQLETMRNSLGLLANGDLSSITNQAARDSANLQAEMSNWQSQMAGYDSMVKSLQDMQSTLANFALNGRPPLLGTGMQAAALAAALRIND